MKHDAARGEWHEGDARYLLIRNDSLMGMFKQLDEPARVAALEALLESVAVHGGRSAARIAEKDRKQLLANVATKAAALGWGIWRFSREDGVLVLEVANSPFAAGHGAARRPVCVPITGMLQSVAGFALGAPALAEELRCAATGSEACLFRAWRRA